MDYLILFSSGRTSAFLSKYFKERHGFDQKIQMYRSSGKPIYTYHKNNRGDRCVFVMMNTGKERKESLKFADRCDKEWDLGLNYLEAVVSLEKGKGTTHRLVKFQNLDRKGEVFESMLKKYPLPTNKASNCTRELKQRPQESFLRFIGWHKAVKVIGIRADEEHRKSINADKENVIYPLCDEIAVDSKFIRTWWDRQPFDLQLRDYEGNCDLCFKKSLKKRLTIVKENPYMAIWWLVQEEQFSTSEVPRFDLRTNVSISDLIEMAKHPFEKAHDKHLLSKQQLELFEFETDCYCKAN
ncbi:hypothetical protein [Chryseobacterium sp.]|uniref:hypothetical protein n=1 Tax=Chryseobacterium sp. TaxID=1871047 RepID=UPI0024E22DCC|nr:hypothetical protein [Chryseobacterium sp.]